MSLADRSERFRFLRILALAVLLVVLAAAVLGYRTDASREADFSSIGPGMTEEDVVARLGPADDGLTRHGTAYVVWSTEERTLVVYFDDEGRVAAEPVRMDRGQPGFLRRLTRWLGLSYGACRVCGVAGLSPTRSWDGE